MKTIDSIECTFTYEGEQFVAEYDLIYDKQEFYVDVLRIEAVSKHAALTLPILRVALKEAYNDAKTQWVEMYDSEYFLP